VLAAVTVDGAEVACTPLLDWLHAACTKTTVNGVAMDASPLARPPLTPPLMDEDLLWHQGEFIVHDLPALDPNMMQHGVQHIVTTLGHLATKTRLTQEEATQAQEARDG